MECSIGIRKNSTKTKFPVRIPIFLFFKLCRKQFPQTVRTEMRTRLCYGLFGSNTDTATLFELLKRDDLAALMAMALSPNELCEVEELCACQRFTSKDKRSHCHGDVEIKRFPLSDFKRNSFVTSGGWYV